MAEWDLTDEELVERIQRGEREYEAQLWLQLKSLIAVIARRYQGYARRYAFIDIDDFIQCGYFAMLASIAEFKPEKGFKFSTYLRRSFMRQVITMLDGKQRHINGKSKTIFPEPQRSLNEMLNSDDGETEFINTLEDEESIRAFNIVEDLDLKCIMDEAIGELEDIQQKVIRGTYYDEEKAEVLVEKLKMRDVSHVYRVKETALFRLCGNMALRELYFAHYHSPKKPDLFKTEPVNVVIATEQRRQRLANLKKELEGIKNGVRF